MEAESGVRTERDRGWSRRVVRQFQAWSARRKLIVCILVTAVLAGCVVVVAVWLAADSDDTRSSSFTSPAWSPDGTKIAFWSDADSGIFVMSPNGENHQRLTRTSGLQTDLEWSPDGTKLAFTEYPNSGDPLIAVLDIQSTKVVRLTTGEVWDEDPTWSPDGNRIAFISTRLGDGTTSIHDVFTMNADGSEQTRVTRTESAWNPAWSPLGDVIAFSDVRDDGTGKADVGLYTISLSTGDTRRITQMHQFPWEAAWSHDGSQLAFMLEPDTNDAGVRIHVSQANGSDLQLLTGPPPSVSDTSPAWSPDGTQIAFESRATDGRSNIYVIDVDGENRVCLTCDKAA